MLKQLFVFLSALLLGTACGPRHPVVQHVIPRPDVAVYNGVYFESTDGMKSFRDITIIPRLLTEEVSLILPDGASILVNTVSPETLRAHQVIFETRDDDGSGNFRLLAYDGCQVEFSIHKPTRLSLLTEINPKHLFAVELRGQKVSLPIKITELENSIGKPDRVEYNTSPPAQ